MSPAALTIGELADALATLSVGCCDAESRLREVGCVGEADELGRAMDTVRTLCWSAVLPADDRRAA